MEEDNARKWAFSGRRNQISSDSSTLYASIADIVHKDAVSVLNANFFLV